MHKTIKKVADDIEAMKFNTAIAAMMTLVSLGLHDEVHQPLGHHNGFRQGHAAGELLHLGVGLGGGDDGLVVRVRRDDDVGKKVADDIEAMKFNTAIAAMMTLVGEFQKNGCSRGDMRTLVTLLRWCSPETPLIGASR